ncbi:SDR family oxidoreductase [Flavobacterium gawalongense]|uniref:NAD-dependent epimerase/dehydratase family protein n=1 Tax=Flavobacterium gawalongense TaxID=2594432 RepID=A0A553BI35_9FLAO|nr:NmrA family NAD(P)-binding protein [Flavobacterium gawalongense]TRX07889.1 NAD-dependent epimerase/dehydratase family protein [Flavobacterium gawalongense]
MKVLVFGATGSQQFHVIEEAKNKGAIVYAVTSSEKNFAKLEKAGAIPVLGDMSDVERMNEITKNIDTIALLIPVSLPNPADGFQFAKNVIDAGKTNGVKMIVWNTSGFVAPQKIGIPMEDVKVETQEYFKQSGVSYVIIQPSIYAENLLAPYTTDYVKNERKVAYPTPEDMPIGWITSRDVSAFVVEALYKPELSGQSFLVSGLDNLKGNDLAKKFSIGLDEKNTFYAMPPQEFGDKLSTLVGEESARGVQSYYEILASQTVYPAKFNPNMKDVLEKLPVKMTPIEEWVRIHKEIFVN